MTMRQFTQPGKIHLLFVMFCTMLSMIPSIVLGQEGGEVTDVVRIGVVDRQQIIRASLAGESVRNQFEAAEKAYRNLQRQFDDSQLDIKLPFKNDFGCMSKVEILKWKMLRIWQDELKIPLLMAI